MKNKNKQKSAYTFMGVAVVAILVLLLGWFYLSSQQTKVVLDSEKTVYFPNDQISVDISIENYKNANEAAVAVNYSENAVLIDSEVAQGVTTRSLDNAIVLEADNSFFESSNNKLATLVFDSEGSGILDFTFDEELTNLNSVEGNIEIEELTNLSVSAGIPGDENDEETKEASGSSLEL